MSLKLHFIFFTSALFLPLVCMAQQPPSPPSTFGGSVAPKNEDPQHAKIIKDMEKRVNQQRQAELQRDTEQLFKLASELKQQVGKSDENVLSLDVMKKAEEIERLARSVREKMKGS